MQASSRRLLSVLTRGLQHPPKEANKMTTFNYGQVISLKLKYADCPSTRDFYCVDQVSVGVIRLLAEQCSFPDWEKLPRIWERPDGKLLVSEVTSSGWIAVRSYPSTDFSGVATSRALNKTLTHLDYVMPILFPDPETALAAAELCYPQPHSALRWTGRAPECMTDPDAQQGYAVGQIGWERSLRHESG